MASKCCYSGFNTVLHLSMIPSIPSYYFSYCRDAGLKMSLLFSFFLLHSSLFASAVLPIHFFSFVPLRYDVMLSHLSPHHPLDGVAGQRVEEHRQEDDETNPGQDLDDRPLVVVPDDVTDRLDRVKEPHEARIGTAKIIDQTCSKFTWKELLCLRGLL